VHLPQGPGDYYRNWATWASAISIGVNIVGLVLDITGLITGP
jgi:hypothetical protein